MAKGVRFLPRPAVPPKTAAGEPRARCRRHRRAPGRGAPRTPPAASRPRAAAPLTSLAVGALPLRPAPAAPRAAPGSAAAAAAGQGAGAAAAPRQPARRAAPRKGGRRGRPGALGRGEAPRGAAGGGLRRRRAGGPRRGTSGGEAGGDLPRPAGSGQRPEHQRHHEAGQCHGASPAGSLPSPLLIAPGMRRGKAGPRRPANPPRRAPPFPPPATSSRLPCVRGKGEHPAVCAATCRCLPERCPAPRVTRPEHPAGRSPVRRLPPARPSATAPPPSLFTRRPPTLLPSRRVFPQTLLPRAWDSSTATFFRGRAPSRSGSPDLSHTLTKGRRSPGIGGLGREQQVSEGGRRVRGAPERSAGNKRTRNKCGEERCLGEFSFIPVPE